MEYDVSRGFEREHARCARERTRVSRALLWVLAPFVAMGVIGVGVLAGPQDARAAECTNEAIRIVQSATSLPTCRAFELVSPSEGTPNLEASQHDSLGVRASSAGGGIAWFSFNPLASSAGGEFYDISRRGQSGWSTEPVGPEISPRTNDAFYCRPRMFFSADLSEGILTDGSHSTGVEQNAEEGECGANDPPLVAEEPEGFQNVFLRDSATGSYALANLTPPGATPADAWFQYASEDFSHVLFEDGAKLSSLAPAGASLYEWVAGAVHLVTVLPDGTPSTGTLPDAVNIGNFRGATPITHSMSADGTRVVFTSAGNLYLRENVEQDVESARGLEGECLESAKACTVQLDASQAEGSGGGGAFLAANVADTKIFFTDEARLTVETVEGSGPHIYEYDTPTGRLTDLTPAGELGLRGLSGIGNDGSYLYVVADAALAEGATPGQPNLYLFHNGAARHVATLGTEDAIERAGWVPSELTARVSPDGRYVAFNSIQRLTGYDNTPAQPGDCEVEALSGPCEEIFLYDAEADELRCVSCMPSGVRPSGPAELPRAERSSDGPAPIYLQRNLLDDGRVFFDTASPLLPGATNGVSNVYEYVAGHLGLISSGTSDANSFFYDASQSGDDVYFVTTQHLVRGDTNNGMRLYDARVAGGFPEPAASSPPCAGEGCRTPPSGTPSLPELATGALGGSGNLSFALPAKHTAKPLTRGQKLKRALRACRRDKVPHRRAACKRRARARYGVRSPNAKHGGGK